MKQKYWLVLLLISVSVLLFADGSETKPVTREEALAIKTKIKSVIAALGSAPSKYTNRKEEYDIPTEMGFDLEHKLFFLAGSSVSIIYKNGTGADELGKSYQKKLLAAQAKGDYATVQKLSMSMQTAIAEATTIELEKVEVRIKTNTSPYVTIDPENVLDDGPGYIVFFSQVEDGKTQVILAFDPTGLLDSKSLTRVDLSESTSNPVAKKSLVKNIVIDLIGPDEVVKTWGKAIDKKKILTFIDR